jgi:TRAP-type uncharacterized transport system substrate-binding protein
VARADLNVDTVKHLTDRQVVIGPQKSGMRLAAERILDKLQISVEPVHANIEQLLNTTRWDAAIITTGPRNPVLRRVLRDERFALISLTPEEVAALTGPEFQPQMISVGQIVSGENDSRSIPARDIRTVTTMTLLVVPGSASNKLVETLLHTLYADQLLRQTYRLISVEEAAQWQFFTLHPAARRFYRAATSKTDMTSSTAEKRGE